MRRSKGLLVLLVAGCAAQLVGHSLPALAQPPTAWVARYSGPENRGDIAYAVAIDASGNVYVTGESGESLGPGANSDYVTIKYDTDGNEIWVRGYNGPGNYFDRATALAVDASGSVYVTGYSGGGATGNDYATIKYDADGNQIWVARYNSGSDVATALAVDASGNVYVTGYSGGSGNLDDYTTIKYDANGNQLWVARYNGPAGSYDFASALVVDASGNAYVTGRSFGSNATYYDYGTIKYDAAGNQLWVARYNGPGSDDDSASALAVDTAGSVYVTGSSYGSGTSSDYATIKYDANGDELWIQRYNGPGNDYDYPSALAIESSGNVYVTGQSFGSGTGQDYATIKYDAEGSEIWAARYSGPGNVRDVAADLALDGAGNVYVTGDSGGFGTNQDYATIKYDAAGNQLWVTRYNGPGREPSRNSDYANAVAIDGAGNVYVTGLATITQFGSGIDSDYVTIKYAAVPNLRVTVTDSQRTDSGIQLTLRLDNRGDASATQVQFTNATLAEQEAASLPQNLGNIPTGSAATTTLTFTGSFAPGIEAVLRVQGSFNGGTFSANQRVTPP
jgi:hypothetical protein